MKSRFLLASFLAFSLLFFTKSRAAETEPNNTPATANTLALNGSNSGAISSSGDIDWYKVTTTSDGQLNLTLTSGNSLNVTAILFDNNGITQLSTTTTAGTTTFSTDGLAAGTYYVEVYAYYSDQTPSYTLSNTLTVASVANDAEPDSSRATALTLPLNSTTTGHINYLYNNHRDTLDWYKVTTNADGLLQLKLTSNNGYNVSAYLFDNNGTTSLGSVTTAGTAYLNTDGLAAGTYYVQINSYYNNQFEPYTLTDSLFKPTQANDAEPDSSRATALTLPLNSTTTGHINFYYNNHRDTLDWYKITTNADGLLQLKLSSNNGSNVSAYLFDNNGTAVQGSVTTAATGYLNIDGLAAGTYYVQVNSYYNNQFEAYTLTDSLFLPAQANDAEPDSSRATALTLPLNSTTTGHINYYYNNHRDTLDWYKITTNADGLLQLKLSSNNGSNVSAYLFDNNGTAVQGSVTTAATGYLNIDGLAAGTYYVQVNSYYNNQFEPYTLTDSLFTYSYTEDSAAEPNGASYLAKTLAANRTTTGHIGFYYNLQRDSTDWWKINYTGTSGNLNLTYNLEPILTGGIQNVTFQVFADTTASPISNITFASSTNTVSLTGLAQGYYYIKVSSYYNNQFEAYSITDNFTQVNIAAAAVRSTRPSLDSCGGNSLTYTLSKSHSPYGVQLYRNGVKYDSVNVVSDTARFNNLPTGNYYATVYGDGATDGAFGTSTVTTFLPPTPKGLTTSNILVHTAQLNWTPYSCVKSYRVQYRLSSATTWTTLDDANDVIGKYTLTGLTMYTNYTWRVASVDTAQSVALIGNYSDTMLFKTLSDTAIITRTKVTAGTTCNSSSIKYTSTHSVAPYTVQLYRNGAVYGSPVSSTDTTLFTGLPAGIYYATSSGTGSGGSFGTSGMDTILPPAPIGLTTTAITTTSATLNWTPLSCEHNYMIEYHKAGVSTWTMINSLANTTGTYTLNGLSVYTSYVWRIASADSAEGKQLLSLYSDSVTFITLSNPARIALFRSVQTNACNSDTLKYIATNSIAPYTVQLYRDSLPYGSPVSVTDTAIFSGLPSGVYYATANGTGSGDTTGKSATTTLAPPFPTSLTTDSITSTTAMLNWTPLSCVSYFTIQYKLSSSATWTNTITVSADSSSYYLTGLTPNTTYNWRIASVDTTNGQFIVSSYSSNATFKTMSVLPVTLISFNAKPVNNTVQLSWQTANETNSKYFAVQRSADGFVFTTVGTVSATGNSTAQHQYSFTDNSPVRGTSYYRLRQVDIDGRYVDSKTITVSFTGTSLFTLYPNPAVNVVHINLFVTGKATITVYDNAGKAVIQKVVSDNATSQQINVSSLSAGIYTVVLQQSDGRQSLNFVKQ